MTVPWEDVRKMPYWIRQGSYQDEEIAEAIDLLLTDADALLAVARAARKAIPFSSSEATSVEEGGKRMGVLIEALKALPEYLREEN